jgi:hypothetical protein
MKPLRIFRHKIIWKRIWILLALCSVLLAGCYIFPNQQPDEDIATRTQNATLITLPVSTRTTTITSFPIFLTVTPAPTRTLWPTLDQTSNANFQKTLAIYATQDANFEAALEKNGLNCNLKSGLGDDKNYSGCYFYKNEDDGLFIFNDEKNSVIILKGGEYILPNTILGNGYLDSIGFSEDEKYYYFGVDRPHARSMNICTRPIETIYQLDLKNKKIDPILNSANNSLINYDFSNTFELLSYIRDPNQLVIRDLSSGNEKAFYSNEALNGLLYLTQDENHLVFGTDVSKEGVNNKRLNILDLSTGKITPILDLPICPIIIGEKNNQIAIELGERYQEKYIFYWYDIINGNIYLQVTNEWTLP